MTRDGEGRFPQLAVECEAGPIELLALGPDVGAAAAKRCICEGHTISSDFRSAVHQELLVRVRSMVRAATASSVALCAAACDPIVNIEGSFFPAWMLCIIVGIGLTVALRYVFVLLRLEPHLGPPVLIYPSLGLLLAMVTWLVLYRN